MSFRTPNKRLVRFALCLLLCGLATLVGAQQPPQPAQGKKAAGKVEKRTYEFKEAGKAMEYALFVPTGYDKDKKAPLVVALHGLGGNPQQMIRSRGLTEQAEKYGYIVVAPMGYNSGGWYGALGPGVGFGGKGFGKGKGKGKGEEVPKNLGELSEKDVMNVLELVRKEFNVDAKRIYLIGHSMGGAGTYYLGSKYPEIWAGLAPIAAATGSPKGVEKLKNIPVFVVHGDNDTAVKVASARQCVARLKEHNIVHVYLEIAGGGHGDVIGTGMPKIFEFFEQQARKAGQKEDKKDDKKEEKKEDKKQEKKQDKEKAQTTDTTAAADKPAGQRVFYASHSLMWDMPPVLAQQAEAYGIKGHTIAGHQRIGVSRTMQHWNMAEAKNQAKKALKEGKVDVFVTSCLVHPDEGITNFVKLGLEHNPNMKFLMQISWPGLGYTDNEQFNAKGKGGIGFGKKGGMFRTPADNKPPEELAKINVIDIKNAEEQAKKLNEQFGKGKTIVYLVPTAQAHNALRTLIYKKEMPGMTDQQEVFSDPIGHPSPPVVALNAYLHFAVLYKQSPVGLPMPSNLKSKKAQWDEKTNRKLQELAWEVVTNYPPSGVTANAKRSDREAKDKVK
jgi:poly(3-hydroxybutyrate) depolymerase